ELGERWGVPDIVSGTLVLAVLTSIPNVITAVRLALHRRGSAVFSETLNSNSINVVAGISVPALFVPFGAACGTVGFTGWWLLAARPHPRPLPSEVRGVHVTMALASLQGKIGEYLSLQGWGLNTIELDVKDENGEVGFVSKYAPLANEVGAAKRYYHPGAVAK